MVVVALQVELLVLRGRLRVGLGELGAAVCRDAQDEPGRLAGHRAGRGADVGLVADRSALGADPQVDAQGPARRGAKGDRALGGHGAHVGGLALPQLVPLDLPSGPALVAQPQTRPEIGSVVEEQPQRAGREDLLPAHRHRPAGLAGLVQGEDHTHAALRSSRLDPAGARSRWRLGGRVGSGRAGDRQGRDTGGGDSTGEDAATRRPCGQWSGLTGSTSVMLGSRHAPCLSSAGRICWARAHERQVTV